MRNENLYAKATEVAEVINGKGYYATVQEVVKRDGTHTGISIRDNAEQKIAPTVYLTEEDIEEENEVLAEKFLKIVDEAPGIDFDPDTFDDYARIKDKIYMVVCPASSALLNDVPHFLVEDIGVYFVFKVDEGSSITIRNAHLTMWGIDFDTLKADAKYPEVVIKSMFDTLREMMGIPEDAEELPPAPDGMYVASSPSKSNGGVCIANPEFYKKIKKMANGKAFYILPSSVHEVLVVFDENGTINVQDLRDMVREVNDTQVAPADLLSYSVYTVKRGKLKIA